MWRIERCEPRWRFWRRGWEYFWALSSYGCFGGRTFTRRGSEKRLMQSQDEMLRD